MGEGFVAHQARALGSEAHHFGCDGAIVGRAAVLAALAPGAKGPFAQVPPRRELQERLDARSRQRDGVLARMAALGGEARGAADDKVRQSLEIALVQKHQPVFFVRQHVLAELGAERREPFADRRQTRLGLRRQPGAGARKIEMIALKHARLFGGKPEPLLHGLQGVDAPEQRVVQIGFAAMAREDGSDFALDRLDLVIGRGAGEIEEDARDLVEGLAAALQRLDRVGEGRRLRIGGDGVDLRPRLLERRLERGPEMAGLDALERRRLERPGPGFEKRVRVDARLGDQRFARWEAPAPLKRRLTILQFHRQRKQIQDLQSGGLWPPGRPPGIGPEFNRLV